MIDIQINKSKIYFTPIFNKVVPILHFGLLKNTYFWYENFKEETFCLLYKFDGKVRGRHKNRTGFTVYENNVLFAHDLLRGYRDYDEHVIYEFDLNDELIDFRNELIEGRYSKISEENKSLIIDFNERAYGRSDANYIARVLQRDIELVDELADRFGVTPESIPEAASAINVDKEVFKNYVRVKQLNREEDEKNKNQEIS